MIKIFTSGRTDLKDFFEKSGNFDGQKLLHTPFVEQDDGIHVRILDDADQLLALPDETLIMGQWQGNYRSDFFQFVVGDYRPFADEKRKQWEHRRGSTRHE